MGFNHHQWGFHGILKGISLRKLSIEGDFEGDFEGDLAFGNWAIWLSSAHFVRGKKPLARPDFTKVFFLSWWNRRVIEKLRWRIIPQPDYG
jgi:hypothetical protein